MAQLSTPPLGVRLVPRQSDGTQILIVPPGLATNPFLYARLAFDPEKDIVPLAQVATLGNLLCVRKDLPVNSVAELNAHAKANPGKLNYASSGVGTTVHLSAELSHLRQDRGGYAGHLSGPGVARTSCGSRGGAGGVKRCRICRLSCG
jgi:hypothetical protein